MMNYDGIIFLIETEKYDYAIDKIKDLLATNIEHSYLYYLYSLCLLGKKNCPEARIYIEKAIAIDSSSSTYLNLYAKIEIQDKNYGKAETLLNESLLLDSGQEEAHAIKSRLFLRKGNINKAVKHSRVVLEIDSSNIFSRNVIALDFIIQDKYEEANDIITRLLVSDPLNSFTLFNHGIIKLYENKIKESKEILRKALFFDPENEGIKRALKQVIVSKNRIAHALFRLSLFTLKYKRVFRWVVGISYKLILIVSVLYHVFSGGDEVGAILIIVLLGFYDVLFIPYQIIPQIFDVILYFDRIGKHLIHTKEVIVTTTTIILFTSGVSGLSYYFFWLNEDAKYILILSLYIIFISGLFSHFNLFNDKGKHGILVSYLLINIFLITVYTLFVEFRIVSTVFILFVLWFHPFILIFINENSD